MDIRTVSDAIYHDDDRCKMEKMNEIYYKMADYIRTYNPDMYGEFVDMAEAVAYEMDKQTAEQIVTNMRPYGQRWSHNEIRNYVLERGVPEEKVCDYYLVMNMCYNDYRRTAEKYGYDRPEFYYDLACDFINDEDGKGHKVAKYFMA